MDATQQDRRQSGRRIDGAIGVKFRVNGGPEHISDTLNFTNRSLAIRSNCFVQAGDKIDAKVDNLPLLEGEVLRVFDEGFAVRLSELSLTLIAHAQAELPNGVCQEECADTHIPRIFSPAFKMQAQHPTWGRIATSLPGHSGSQRHNLSVITTDPINLDLINSVWINIEQARWVARLLRAGKRGKQSVIVILVNDWQLRMAASHGFSVSLIRSRHDEWAVSADAAPVADYLASLKPEDHALSA